MSSDVLPNRRRGCVNSIPKQELKMTKQSASKKISKASVERPVAEQEKSSPQRKRMGSEIDEIFAGKKRKRPEKEANTNAVKPSLASGANSKSHEKMSRKKSKSSNASAFGDSSTSRSRKKTADGLALYSEEELGIGKADAGGTALCPFDCNCCF